MSEPKETIAVITSDAAPTRAWGGPIQLDVAVLSDNVQRFMQQVERVLAKAPSTLGEFRFDEVELHAEISAKGTLSLLGTGGEGGATGGLKFVFRREPRKPHS